MLQAIFESVNARNWRRLSMKLQAEDFSNLANQ
jgi:hypothetical protein